MHNLFSHEGFLYQILEKVADFVILSLITFLCCLPVFTMGTALVASHKVTQDRMMGKEPPVIRTYFQAFASNFKKSTLLWLITLAVAAFLVGDFMIVHEYFEGSAATFSYGLLGVVSFLVLGTVAYALPMMARYENTLKAYIRNGILLAVGNLPKTILMVLLYAIPILSIEILISSLLFWVLFGVSGIIFLQTRLVKSIFQKLEQPKQETETAEI